MTSLAGHHIVVTAGPTVEPIDPVRFLSNRSSGKQGYAIASALAVLGARVTLVSGPVSLLPLDDVETIHVETAREMLAAVLGALPAECFVAVAAVADWRPAEAADIKMKKGPDGPPSIRLVENPDILALVSAMPAATRPALVVGFAAETNDVEAHAHAKIIRKRCNWIVANDVSGDVMGGDQNIVSIITEAGVERLARMPKTKVAEALAARIAAALA